MTKRKKILLIILLIIVALAAAITVFFVKERQLNLDTVSKQSIYFDPTSPNDAQLIRADAKAPEKCNDRQPLKRALFGDLHVHTTFSFDAYGYGVRTTPDDAYRFAKGEEIAFFPIVDGVMDGRIRIDRPLDFLAVTDHAEFLGEYQICSDRMSGRYWTPYCMVYRRGGSLSLMQTGMALAMDPAYRISSVCRQGDTDCLKASSIPWQKIVAAAQAAQDTSADCSFTSLVGYEYTGSPGSSNYHRNVIFSSGNVPAIPVSKFEAPLDWYLWEKLDAVCRSENGCDYLTIPHNSNLSNGKLLIPYADLSQDRDNKIAYAQKRLEREPLIEIFQHKGNSECANGFPGIIAAPDELCDMEQLRIIGKPGKTGGVHRVNGKVRISEETDNPTVYCDGDETGRGGIQNNGCLSRNDFWRSAMLKGLAEQNEIGLNPVKLGASASTDTHMSVAGSTREDNWRGHIHTEWNRDGRLDDPALIPSSRNGNPGGLTGVWAEENSRTSIFSALKRRETFGTSGSRIQPRFFAGWDYPDDLCDDPQLLQTAYAGGVPMGSDLDDRPSGQATPVFLLSATADPVDWAAPLQKLQLVKGWVDQSGQMQIKVIDVAGNAQTDAGVDRQTGQRFGEGFSQLCAVYRDTDYDPTDNAYYYMRAVENPSPRWSLIDCLSYAEAERPESCDDPSVFTTINEQAWTSPIWISPEQ